MKSIILAGGLGTRLRPTTLNLPKQLIKLAGKSIIEHSINKIHMAGFNDIGVVVSPNTLDTYKKRLSHIKDVEFIVQDKPLGLAHAVQCCRPFLGDTDPFLAYLGDNIFETELPNASELKEEFEAKIILKYVDDPRSLGVAVVNESKVIGLVEKPIEPPSNYGVCGMYLLKPSIWRSIENLKPSKRGELEITDAIANLIGQGSGVSYKVIEGYWYDAGSFNDLLKANDSLLKSHHVAMSLGSHVYKTSVGDDCVLQDCRISNSILLDNVKIRYSEIEDSIIGENVIINSSIRLKNAHIGCYSKIGL